MHSVYPYYDAQSYIAEQFEYIPTSRMYFNNTKRGGKKLLYLGGECLIYGKIIRSKPKWELFICSNII